jgi:hypothetical protein
MTSWYAKSDPKRLLKWYRREYLPTYLPIYLSTHSLLPRRAAPPRTLMTHSLLPGAQPLQGRSWRQRPHRSVRWPARLRCGPCEGVRRWPGVATLLQLLPFARLCRRCGPPRWYTAVTAATAGNRVGTVTVPSGSNRSQNSNLNLN